MVPRTPERPGPKGGLAPPAGACAGHLMEESRNRQWGRSVTVLLSRLGTVYRLITDECLDDRNTEKDCR